MMGCLREGPCENLVPADPLKVLLLLLTLYPWPKALSLFSQKHPRAGTMLGGLRALRSVWCTAQHALKRKRN